MAPVSYLADLIGPSDHLIFILLDGLGMNIIRRLPSSSFLARHVRAGGLFIFRLLADTGSSPLTLVRLLEQHGFSVQRRIDRGRRALVVARREDAAMRKAA